MSRIAVASRSPIYANGIIDSLKNRSQVFSYQSFLNMRVDFLNVQPTSLKGVDCLIYCVDFKKDFQLLEKLDWSRTDMSIVLLSSLNMAILESYARKYGVHAILDSNIDLDEFVRCVEHVFLSDQNEVMSIIRKSRKPELLDVNNYQLTKREYQILNLISMSLNNKQIAKKLFISDHTVSVHRKNLMKKMHVNNAAGLISKAFREQLIEF